MSGENGRAAVLAEAVKGAGSGIAREDLAAAGEQMPLFEVPTRFVDHRAELQRDRIERARGPGRPPGAQNLSTARMRAYLLARGVNPLEQLARWAQHTPESLALELRCSKLEAFRELRATWGELAPYLFGRAVPTDDEGRAVPQFVMVLGGATTAGPGARPPWEYLEAVQEVSEAAPEKSHGEQSHGVAK